VRDVVAEYEQVVYYYMYEICFDHGLLGKSYRCFFAEEWFENRLKRFMTFFKQIQNKTKQTHGSDMVHVHVASYLYDLNVKTFPLYV
jgi:hypothetical protein